MIDEEGQELNQQCLFDEMAYLKCSIEKLHDEISEIKKPLDLEFRAARAIEVLDKFENYMKNIDKLNILVNEVKGLVACVRAAYPERFRNRE